LYSSLTFSANSVILNICLAIRTELFVIRGNKVLAIVLVQLLQLRLTNLRVLPIFSDLAACQKHNMPLSPFPRALLFDVFGTCVDWRSTVTNGLEKAAHESLDSASSSIPSNVRLRAEEMNTNDWGKFAQEWRDTYKVFTKSRANDASLPMKTVDQHHYDALQELLAKWELERLFTASELEAVSLLWHHLDPWPDSAKGMAALSSLCSTCTLSNGNTSLLQDLKLHAKLAFTHVFSAEDFGTFKPNKAVYLGAAEKLRVSPSECAMVAAHLADLKAAKGCGYQTIYVERLLEEDWTAQQVESAKADGFVDIWVSEKEDGFLAVAERLGSKK